LKMCLIGRTGYASPAFYQVLRPTYVQTLFVQTCMKILDLRLLCRLSVPRLPAPRLPFFVLRPVVSTLQSSVLLCGSSDRRGREPQEMIEEKSRYEIDSVAHVPSDSASCTKYRYQPPTLFLHLTASPCPYAGCKHGFCYFLPIGGY
jgi:hypothetical protein